MKFIKGDTLTEDIMKVTFVHHFPDMLTSLEKQGGYLIEDFEQPERIEGKSALLYFNPLTRQISFEYEDLPLAIPEVDQIEEINRLKNQVSLIQQALDDILLNGGML